MKRIIPLLIILLFSCHKEELVDVSNKEELENVIESAFNLYQMPGLAYLAVKNDSVVISGAMGYANVKDKIPFTPQTRMIIASISKTIIATAIMQLVENGRIDINEDINQYLPFTVRNPKYPNEPITTKMLLTHTSSITDGGYISAFYLYGFVDYPVTLLNFEKEYLSENGQYYTSANYSNFKPNSNYEYSNVAAALAACLVEQVSGVSFNDYCKSHIFQPLGMSKTTWFFSETPKSEIAIPYSDLNNMNPDNPFFSYPTYPDGHLITTTEDLSRFMRAYIMDGTFNGYQLLQSSSVDTILSVQYETKFKQGLIFYNLESPQFSVWGHNGGDPGVSTEMYFDKTKKVGLIVFTNRSDAYSQTMKHALLQFANQ